MLADFQKMIGLRNQHEVLRRGSIDAPVQLDENVIVLTRKYKGTCRAVTAFNNSTTPRQVTVDLPPGYDPKPYQDAVTGRSVQPVKGKLTLTVPALSGSVLITK